MSFTPYSPELLTAEDQAVRDRAQVRLYIGDTGEPNPMDRDNYRFADAEIDFFIAENWGRPCFAAVDMMRAPGNAARVAQSAVMSRTIGKLSVTTSGSTAADLVLKYAADLESRCRAKRALTGISSGGGDPRAVLVPAIFTIGQFDPPGGDQGTGRDGL